MSAPSYRMVDGQFGPEPVSTRTDDDSIAECCCSDDAHEHGPACERDREDEG